MQPTAGNRLGRPQRYSIPPGEPAWMTRSEREGTARGPRGQGDAPNAESDPQRLNRSSVISSTLMGTPSFAEQIAAIVV